MTIVSVETYSWRAMEDGTCIGWVSCSRNPSGVLELSWGTSEGRRREGVATRIGRVAFADLGVVHGGGWVVAGIRPANLASLATARALGMWELKRSDDEVTMTAQLR